MIKSIEKTLNTSIYHSLEGEAQINELELKKALEYVEKREVELGRKLLTDWAMVEEDYDLETEFSRTEGYLKYCERIVEYSDKMREMETRLNTLLNDVQVAKDIAKRKEEEAAIQELLQEYDNLFKNLISNTDYKVRVEIFRGLERTRKRLMEHLDYMDKDALVDVNLRFTSEKKKIINELKQHLKECFSIKYEDCNKDLLQFCLLSFSELSDLFDTCSEFGVYAQVEKEISGLIKETADNIVNKSFALNIVDERKLEFVKDETGITVRKAFQQLLILSRFLCDNIPQVNIEELVIVLLEKSSSFISLFSTEIPDSLEELQEYVKSELTQNFDGMENITSKFIDAIYGFYIKKKIWIALQEVRPLVFDSDLETCMVEKVSYSIVDFQKELNINIPDNIDFPELYKPIVSLPTCQIHKRMIMIVDIFESVCNDFETIPLAYQKPASYSLLDLAELLRNSILISVMGRESMISLEELSLFQNDCNYFANRLQVLIMKRGTKEPTGNILMASVNAFKESSLEILNRAIG